MKNIRFSTSEDNDFSEILTKRVYDYFDKNGINTYANKPMVLKTLLFFGFYTAIYLFILNGNSTNLVLLFVLWGTLGLLQSFIGMSIMHDTVHEAYTKSRFIRFFLQLPILAIGVEPKIWKIEHNIIHHTYTNVEGIDQDIHPRYLFRFTKNQPKKWFHAYQHLYSTLIYSLLIIEWVTIKDFLMTVKYHRMHFIKTKRQTALIIGMIVIKKTVFFYLFLILPLKTLDFKPHIIVLMFLTMMVVAGISMTIIFQLAHVVPKITTENNHENLSKINWKVYQLATTCDFAHKNKPLTYLIGGLNYQIEHHLFPHICHIHYPEIAKIVRETTKEYHLPYHYEETLFQAIKSHYSHLKELGRN